MSESWRPVVGFETWYEVSDTGLVRSCDYIETYEGPHGTTRRRHRGRIKTLSLNHKGYRIVHLRRDRKSIQAPVHRLVLEAFVGPRPPGMVACHNDGNALNNHASNLRWDTQSNNILDSVSHGTQVHARKTHCPKGHEYDAGNTYYSKFGRQCRACKKDRPRQPRSYERERLLRRLRIERRAEAAKKLHDAAPTLDEAAK